MTELPVGWTWTTVGELGDVMLGRQRAPKYHSGPNMRPYLRVKNVFENRIDLSDVMEMDFSSEEFERYRLEPGDILLNEGQSPELIGRPAMYQGELPGACFTNSLIRFRAKAAIQPLVALYLFRHYMHSGRFQREARITTNIAHLSAGRFASIEVALPPLQEQRRIVATIEENFPRLDAAVSALRSAQERAAIACRSVLATAFSGFSETYPLVSLSESDRPICYGILKPKTVGELVVPYVEVRSIRDGRIDAGSLHRTTTALHEEFARSKLRAGDVVMAIRGSWDRAAVVQQELDGANISRDVARIAPIADLDPQFLAHYLASPLASRYFTSVARGVGVRGVNISDLRLLPVPCPSAAVQQETIGRIDIALSSLNVVTCDITAGLRRAVALRRAILASAFRGNLVPQDPGDEPAESLITRTADAGDASPKRPRSLERTPA